jgi:hypothetical protein
VDTLLGVVIGGVITFLTSRWYYHRASEDLRQEAKELRHYLGITLRVLQALSDNKHSFVINWDEHGRPIGVSYHRSPPADATGQEFRGCQAWVAHVYLAQYLIASGVLRCSRPRDLAWAPAFSSMNI